MKDEPTIEEQIDYQKVRLVSRDIGFERAILRSLRRVKLLEAVAVAARESTCCSEHPISGHACGRHELAMALVAFDAARKEAP